LFTLIVDIPKVLLKEEKRYKGRFIQIENDLDTIVIVREVKRKRLLK